MKILFTGDFSASGIFHEKIISGRSLFDIRILTIFKNSDYVHINLENPITATDFRKKYGVCLKAPPITGKFLKDCGINVCNLANNHIMDCDIQGLRDTIFSLSKNEILYYGIGGIAEYTLLKKEDLKVILLSSCYKEGPLWNGTTIAPLNMSINSIKLLIAQVKKAENPDYIIFNYHGGTEFNIIPEPRRRAFFHKLIQECEIDVIIGHHAHVPQGIERIDNKLIIYGLGNLCFDLHYHKNKPYTNISYFVELILGKNHQISLKKYFYTIDYEEQIVFLNSNTSLTDSIYLQLQVFENNAKYIDAWEKECFRMYFKNQIIGSSLSIESLSRSKNVKDTPLRIGKMVRGIIKQYRFSIFPKAIWKGYTEIKNPCRRPFLIGALIYIFKRGFK